jgi:putative ABC transport system permease protein
MRWIDIFRISYRMLRSNGLRSLLTILGIGVAIGLIVLLIGIGYGLQNVTIGSIVESKALLSMDISSPDSDLAPLKIASQDKIKNTTGIHDVTPVVATAGELKVNDKLAAVTLTAANPSYLEMAGVELNRGTTYTENSTDVLVSPKLLELLDLSESDILNKDATLTYTDPNNENESKAAPTLKIIGITKGNDTDAAAIYTPFSLLADDHVADIHLTEFKAVANNRDAVVAARDSLTKQGFLVDTLLQTLDQARTVFRWVTLGLSVFGTIALVVAAIGMFNTLTISLMERTREIGVMKSLGVTDIAIRRLFLSEAIIIGFGGGIIGVFIGLLFDQVLNGVVDRFAERFGSKPVDLFQYPAGFLILMVLYPTLLAILTGLYPAMRAAKLNPLRALRYE